MPKKHIEISPELSVVKARLFDARMKMKQMRGPFTKIAVLLDRWVQSNIKSEGGKYGGWPPFKRGGRTVRRASGTYLDRGAKLLRDTGRLASSFIPFSDKDDAGIGSDLPYAKTHDEGLGHVPQRKILPEDNNRELKGKARKVLDDHVNKICRNFRV